MASPGSEDLATSADEASRIIEMRGYFNRPNARIAALVDELYKEGRQRSAKIDHFRPMLQEDPSLSKVFEPYSNEPLRAIPWGTTPEGYYAWSPGLDSGLVFYMMGSGSRFAVRDGSHKLKLEPERREIIDIGMCKMPDDLLEPYRRTLIDMERGGILIIHPSLSHQTAGRSIAIGGLPTVQAGRMSNNSRAIKS